MSAYVLGLPWDLFVRLDSSASFFWLVTYYIVRNQVVSGKWLS